LFCPDFQYATIVPTWSLVMRTIREILLTEYIGAILIAVLIADAFSALISTTVGQILSNVQFRPALNIHRLSTTYSVLSALVRTALFLIAAYLIARWLYPAKATEMPQDAKGQERS